MSFISGSVGQGFKIQWSCCTTPELTDRGTYSILAKRMGGDPPAIDARLDREFTETNEAIDLAISELNSIVKPMWAEYFGGARLQELYTAATPGYVPKVEMGTVPNRLSRNSLASIVQKLPELQIGHWKIRF